MFVRQKIDCVNKQLELDSEEKVRLERRASDLQRKVEHLIESSLRFRQENLLLKKDHAKLVSDLASERNRSAAFQYYEEPVSKNLSGLYSSSGAMVNDVDALKHVGYFHLVLQLAIGVLLVGYLSTARCSKNA